MSAYKRLRNAEDRGDEYQSAATILAFSVVST